MSLRGLWRAHRIEGVLYCGHCYRMSRYSSASRLGSLRTAVSCRFRAYLS